MKTLAEFCFESQYADDDLFRAIHEIMGGTPAVATEMPVLDTCVDSYDGSVEVILSPDTPPMTREQADAILALGFCSVYESNVDLGICWSKTGREPCSRRTADQDAAKIRKLTMRIAELEARIADLQTGA